MLASVDEIVAKLAATCDTGDAVEVAKSFEVSELPAMVVNSVATVVVTIDANLLVTAVVAAVAGTVVGVLSVILILSVWRREANSFIFVKLIFVLCFTYFGIIVAIVVDAVILLLNIDGGVGTNGYCGQVCFNCSPIIESKTLPMRDPAVRPTLYESVIMLPVTSFNVAGTLAGANIIGKLPAKPFVMPRAALNMNAGVSPAITGCARGAQQSNSSGTNAILIVDSRINCRRDHVYGNEATSLPITSDVLNVNISKTGIQSSKLQEMICDTMPGYTERVTQ